MPIAITLRFFRDKGADIWLAVLSSGASGVEDGFCQPSSIAAKAAIREREQQASYRLFGLADERVAFLRLTENEAGDPGDDTRNYSVVRAHLQKVRGPGVVAFCHTETIRIRAIR